MEIYSYSKEKSPNSYVSRFFTESILQVFVECRNWRVNIIEKELQTEIIRILL